MASFLCQGIFCIFLHFPRFTMASRFPKLELDPLRISLGDATILVTFHGETDRGCSFPPLEEGVAGIVGRQDALGLGP